MRLADRPVSATRHLATARALAHEIGKLSGYVTAVVWAAHATRVARSQLRSGGLNAVALPAVPEPRPGSARGVRDGARVARASCLERSLVRRAWHAKRGRDVRIVIGVRGTSGAFGAHAWLEGDPPDPGEFRELMRWPE